MRSPDVSCFWFRKTHAHEGYSHTHPDTHLRCYKSCLLQEHREKGRSASRRRVLTQLIRVHSCTSPTHNCMDVKCVVTRENAGGGRWYQRLGRAGVRAFTVRAVQVPIVLAWERMAYLISSISYFMRFRSSMSAATTSLSAALTNLASACCANSRVSRCVHANPPKY